MGNIILNDEIIKRLTNFIQKVGGLENALMITGVSNSSLQKYISMKTKIIVRHIWRNYLSDCLDPKSIFTM